MQSNEKIPIGQNIKRDDSTINRLAAVGQIAAGIAHEVRNPLTAVKGFLDLLKEKQPHEYIDIALGELDQALVTMQNLLNVVKPNMDNEPYTYLNITVELESILYLFQNQQYRIEVKTDFRDTNVRIYGKQNQIKRALFNLIKNAFEAIPNEGVIIVRHFRQDDKLFISISDTGVGIPEDKMDLLGTPFYTSKETGTGMGLAQVFSTVYDHDGKVHVQSEVDVGTIFTLEFPIIERTEIGVEDLNLTYTEGQSFSDFFEANKQNFINSLQSQVQNLFNHIRDVDGIDEEYITNHLKKIVRLLNDFDEFGLVMHAKESGKNWAKFDLDLILKLEWFQAIRKVYWDFLYNYYNNKEIVQRDLFELERKVNNNMDILLKHFAASYTEYKDYLISAQSELIEDLNVPIIPLTDSMAVLPIVGTVDTKRARSIQRNVLDEIYQQNIKRIIIDLSGVTYMDTAVLGHLFNIINGIRIQGCKATLTGVRPEITNTIVELGIELHEKIDTMGTLKQAIQMYSKEFDEVEV